MSLDVLIADQDVDLARLYCRFLTKHGLTTAAVASGLECLGMVHDREPRVLVLDHELPWGDGEGVLACLRADGLSLPVILTTWKASPEMARQLVIPPVIMCLRKFIPLSSLFDRIRSAIRCDGSREVFSDSLVLSQQGEATWSASR